MLLSPGSTPLSLLSTPLPSNSQLLLHLWGRLGEVLSAEDLLGLACWPRLLATSEERGGEGRAGGGLLLRYSMPNIMVPVNGPLFSVKGNNNTASHDTGELLIGDSCTVFLVSVTLTEQVMNIKLASAV